MLVQLYRVRIREPEKVKPAQMVFENNESSTVIGFIYIVDGVTAQICLFDPTDSTSIKTPFEPIKEAVEWKPILVDAISRNRDIAEEWKDALTRSAEKNP
jgi:hypothetical protein